jgi:hypothetical protein
MDSDEAWIAENIGNVESDPADNDGVGPSTSNSTMAADNVASNFQPKTKERGVTWSEIKIGDYSLREIYFLAMAISKFVRSHQFFSSKSS